MDRLKREANPPTGQLASPVPQYKDTVLNDWAEVKGEGGASYVKDKDVFAKLEQARALLDAISGKDFATQTTLATVLAKLADLESELATIKANQTSGDQKVQLSGTIVERVVAIPRGVRANDTELNAYQVRVPNGAKGFVATLEILGATGTFNTNQGAALYCYARGQQSSINRSLGLDLNTERSTSQYSCPVIMMYPGINHVPEGRYVQISRVAFGQYWFQIQINGTFESGQGIDCAMIIEWLL